MKRRVRASVRVRTNLMIGLFVLLWTVPGLAQFEDSNESDAPDSGPSVQASRPIDKKDLSALAEARRNKSEPEMLAAASRILGLDSRHPQALNALAVFHFERGQTGMAKIILQRALKDHPQESALHNNLGVVFLAEGKLRQALLQFRKSMDLTSGYRIGAANLGSIMAEYSDYKKALAPLEMGYKAVRSQLKSGMKAAVEVANNYAVALAGVGDFEASRKIYQEILEGSGREPLVLLNYAVLLIEKLKDYKEGGKVISRVKFAIDDPKLLKRAAQLEKVIDTQNREK